MSRVEARLAIRPITVLSPVRNTIPRPVPSTAFVEKKAMFLVSSGFSWVLSIPLPCGSLASQRRVVYLESPTFDHSYVGRNPITKLNFYKISTDKIFCHNFVFLSISNDLGCGWNEVFEAVHDGATLGFLIVGETTCDYDH